MHDQHRPGVIRDLRQRMLPGGGDDNGKRHVVTIAEPIEGPQIGGSRQLVGQRAARMLLHLVVGFGQPLGAAGIAQLCIPKNV